MEGGIFMRILLTAVIIFVIIHFIRIDLVEGTIPPLSFAVEEQQPCENETLSILVTSIDGDTVESLFALYPDPETSVIDRLTKFYTLNPHLQRQTIIGGEKIKLPLSSLQSTICLE